MLEETSIDEQSIVAEKKQPDNINHRLQGSRFDKILRENMRLSLPGIIEKVLKLDIAKSEELKDKIQITRQKEVDTLRLVTDASGATYVLQVEYESSNKPKLNFRMAEYRAMLHQIYDYPVKQYVLYVGKKKLTTSNRINLPGFKFQYSLISFADLPYKMFLSSDEPEEQILAILADFGKDDPSYVIQSVLAKIGKNAPDELTENRYFQQLRVIIQLRNLDTQLKKAMESVTTFFKEERDILYCWGKEKGETTKAHAVVENLILKLALTNEQIADVAEVSVAFVKEVRKELDAKK